MKAFMKNGYQSNILKCKDQKPPIEAAQVVILIQQELSQRTIAQQLHLSLPCVSKVYKKFRETGNLVRRSGPG